MISLGEAKDNPECDASIAGNLLQLSPEATYGFTAGVAALLVINVFLMVIGTLKNLRFFLPVMNFHSCFLI